MLFQVNALGHTRFEIFGPDYIDSIAFPSGGLFLGCFSSVEGVFRAFSTPSDTFPSHASAIEHPAARALAKRAAWSNRTWERQEMEHRIWERARMRSEDVLSQRYGKARKVVSRAF